MAEILSRADGPSIAYARRPGANGGAGAATRPGIVFLGGFMSDMSGVKATWLESFAAKLGCPYLRFDYSGHGASEGRFEDGTISGWLSDTLMVLDRLTEGPQILIGSSMGGWLALRAALERPARVAGIVGVAAAPDFTEELVSSDLTPEQRETLMRDGVVYIDTPYGDNPYAFTRALIEDGRNHLLLESTIEIGCPVRLVQGYDDNDVPWEMAMAIMARIGHGDCAVTLIKDGDHRLSRSQDLTKIGAAVKDILRTLAAEPA
ncbi:MAG TPA: alpha/beta hydrolase [Alphaproteobacteria bacterium]|nr:alpha/beta hydrolase [Alphaproteobacteria bacterium]